MAQAFELKFLLPDARAAEVEAWARKCLKLDPHGDPTLGGGYRTTSLYCDTPEYSVYFRSPAYYRPRKFRIRRYGSESWSYLERKTRWGDRVAKWRTRIPAEELSILSGPGSPSNWPGHDYHRRLLERRLAAACQIAYHRTAFVGEGESRLTLDRRVEGAPTTDWTLEPLGGMRPLLVNQVILELKFVAAPPALFKNLVRDMKLDPGSISKYRLCWQAWGGPKVHA